MMGMKKMMIVIILLLIAITMLSACSSAVQLVNEITVSLDHITELQISYDEENITFFPGNGTDLVVKEYMSANKKGYHANMKKQDGKIKISEGGKPLMKDKFQRYIEVYLPPAYQQCLIVTSTSGKLDISRLDLNLSAFSVDNTSGEVQLASLAADTALLKTSSGSVTCNAYTGRQFTAKTTSGTFNLGQIKAPDIKLESTSGSMHCGVLNGAVSYTTTSGDLNVAAAIGSGQYMANNSGALRVVYQEVTGNLSLFNKNGDIDLTIPANLSLRFAAKSKNGAIHTSFDHLLKKSEKEVAGTMGNAPSVTVELETKDGNIQVSQSHSSVLYHSEER